MKPLRFCRKGRFLNAAEELELYRAHVSNSRNRLNEQLPFKFNYLFVTAIELEQNRNSDKKHTQLYIR